MAKKYVGLDVHMASTSYCVRDGEGKVVAEGIAATSGANLVSLIRGIPGEVHLTFEEGTQAAWLYDLLKSYVKRLIVCDPARRVRIKRTRMIRSTQADCRNCCGWVYCHRCITVSKALEV